MVGVGIGIVEQMHGISGHRLPTNHLDKAFAFNLHHLFITRNPANSVVQQPQQIAVASKPVGALDVSGEVGDTGRANFAKHNCRLIALRDRWVSQFRRIAHKSWNYSKHRILHGL